MKGRFQKQDTEMQNLHRSRRLTRTLARSGLRNSSLEKSELSAEEIPGPQPFTEQATKN